MSDWLFSAVAGSQAVAPSVVGSGAHYVPDRTERTSDEP
jgi:hypothetical protein